jgi:2-hydroxy-6-oxonona-2,4-dienedioate hydrolase
VSTGISEAKAPITEATTSRFVEKGGLRLHFNDAGEGHPVVFLHGSGPGATGWSNFGPNIVALSRRFRTIALDMPGWGKSALEIPGDGTLVTAVKRMLDALDIERAALVGNSLGGMVALAFAAEHPERCSHLVTMGAPTPGVNVFSASGMDSEGLRVLVGTYRDPSPASFKRLVEVMCFDAKFATDELAKERSDTALQRPEQLKAFLEWRLFRLPSPDALAAKLPKLGVPTLAIHGRNDRTVHFESSLRLVSLIPNSRLVMMNRCGHWAQLEHAAEFNRLVGSFIAETN